MRRYEFKKFPLLAIVLTILALVSAVASITISLAINDYGDGIVFLALLEIVAAVLILAGLTTGRTTLVRVISIIITVGLLVSSFILSIVKYSTHDIWLFGVALLMLIDSVLGLVYFVSLKNERIQKMHAVTSITFASLTFVYFVIYTIVDVAESSNDNAVMHPYFYALLIAYIFVSLLPFVVHTSLSKIEDEVSTVDNQEDKNI